MTVFLTSFKNYKRNAKSDYMKTRRNLAILAVASMAFLVGAILWFFLGNPSWWHEGGESFADLMHEKGHWYLELFVGFLELVIVDILFLFIGWKLLLKPYIAERQANLVAEEHELHGVEEHNHDLHEEYVHNRDAINRKRLRRAEGLLEDLVEAWEVQEESPDHTWNESAHVAANAKRFLEEDNA